MPTLGSPPELGLVSQGSFALRIAGSAVHLYSILQVYELMSANNPSEGMLSFVVADQAVMETHFDSIGCRVKTRVDFDEIKSLCITI